MWVCSLRVKANSVFRSQCGRQHECEICEFCVQYGRWIRGRCAGVKRVTAQCTMNLTCRKCEHILERQWNRKISYVMK